MKTILLATNLGLTSRHALERALLIARSRRASLHVVHVAEDKLRIYPVEREVEAALERLQFDLEDHFGAGFAPASVKKLAGDPADAIASEAASLGAELIVAGISEQSVTGSKLEGTILERLLMECDAPLVVVKNRPAGGYDRVLAALDISQTSRRALATALKVAPTAHFVIVHALERAIEDDAVRGNVNRLVRSAFQSSRGAVGMHQGAVEIHFDEGAVAAAVAKRVDRHLPDLVVFGRHNKGAAGGRFIGSGARGILEAVDADMLVTAVQ